MTTAIPTATPMAEGPARDALLLLSWLSPGYPVGAYAYSHGLEWAAEAGDVRDEASLRAWLADVLAHGAARNDAILAAHAHAAGARGDAEAAAALNDLALALAPSRELHLETSQQGRSFLDATCAAWPVPALSALAGRLAGPVAYPVAVGLAAGAHGIARPMLLTGYLAAFLQNLVSAALRLAPVGQSAGTRVVASLSPAVAAVAAEAEAASLNDIGAATVRLDLGSFRHETQYSRIFRS
ncbi:urease accessory protein UreF [Methylobacterium nodulans]|uniref:Urease accessory protein UreF n=1 Tax=Methylobacterium nodulans (strain LMG 21967 / CNCM I-2342 / ORS 2060) TaxID=460265 RepID=B8IJ84_METNO|nr:urease accessory UreF family protein [Methylobacterium nodulans]ACL56099.1 Urease accessory protein UreF [Methylobacterium nodulans ORS 2060]